MSYRRDTFQSPELTCGILIAASREKGPEGEFQVKGMELPFLTKYPLCSFSCLTMMSCFLFRNDYLKKKKKK